MRVVRPLQDAAGEDPGRPGEILRPLAEIAQAIAQPHHRPVVGRFQAQRRLKGLDPLGQLFGVIGGLPPQRMVQGHRRGSLVGQLRIGLCRRLFPQGLAAAGTQRIERLRRPVGALGFAQVNEGLSGGRFRGELLLGPMLLLPANDVIRQPEQLLVSEASNLLDLLPSQKATLQGAVPVVTLQDAIELEGLQKEGDRCGGPPFPRPCGCWRSRTAVGTVRRQRGFEEGGRFRLVRSIDQVQELLKPVQVGLAGLDFRRQVAQRRPVVPQLRPGLGQLLARRGQLVFGNQGTGRVQGIADLALHCCLPGGLRLLDLRLPRRAVAHGPADARRHHRHGQEHAGGDGQPSLVPPRELPQAIATPTAGTPAPARRPGSAARPAAKPLAVS